MNKYYLGSETRYSMQGKLISTSFLLVDRSTKDNVNSIFEKMSISTPFGKFAAEIEFRFVDSSNFLVINKMGDQEMGRGVCVGAFDNPTAMIDTISISQTQEKVISVFSFEKNKINVSKAYFSLDGTIQLGFAIEKCVEIELNRFQELQSSPPDSAEAWKKLI
jgi:hypothetical protein